MRRRASLEGALGSIRERDAATALPQMIALRTPLFTLKDIVGVFDRIRRAGYDGSRCNPQLRGEFLEVKDGFSRMYPQHQVALIAEYAQQCLLNAQALIDQETAESNGQIAAITIWESVLDNRAENRDGRMSDSDLIGKLFPTLKLKGKEIANILNSAYSFWGHFCACSEYGVIGGTEAQHSPIGDLSKEQQAAIDAASGMRSLGINMRNYAGYLFMTGE
jgi:hypothetical protein